MSEKTVWEARDSGLWNNRRSCIVFVAGSDVEAKRLESYMNDAVDSAVALTSERDEAVRKLAYLESMIEESNGHYCDGMSMAWSDAQDAINKEAEAVRVAGELRAKAALADEIRQQKLHHTVFWWAEYIEEWRSRYDALTQGGDLPLKEQE